MCIYLFFPCALLFVCVLVKHVSVIVTPIKFLNLESYPCWGLIKLNHVNKIPIWRQHNWKGNVILTNYSSLTALTIVKMITFIATSDGNLIKMTTVSFQWFCICHSSIAVVVSSAHSLAVSLLQNVTIYITIWIRTNWHSYIESEIWVKIIGEGTFHNALLWRKRVFCKRPPLNQDAAIKINIDISLWHILTLYIKCWWGNWYENINTKNSVCIYCMCQVPYFILIFKYMCSQISI